MNLISNRINFSPSALLQEALSSPLSDQQKRIFGIAVVAFALLAVAYAVMRCCFNTSVNQTNPSNPPSGQVVRPPTFENAFTLDIGRQVSIHLKQLKQSRHIVSAKCFVKIEFDQGEIKKEFVLKQLMNNVLVVEQIKKMEDYFEQVSASLGHCQKAELMVLFKGAENRFHKYSYHAEKQGSAFVSGSSSAEDMTANVLAQAYLKIRNEMGFPKEKQMVNGEFVPGSLNVPL